MQSGRRRLHPTPFGCVLSQTSQLASPRPLFSSAPNYLYFAFVVVPHPPKLNRIVLIPLCVLMSRAPGSPPPSPTSPPRRPPHFPAGIVGLKAGATPAVTSATIPAVKAGMSGATAAAAQSLSFMWISTAAAFQYRSGTSMVDAFRTLYAQGGIPRFYNGLIPTVMHITLCRFGDVTMNGVALDSVPSESTTIRTAVGSVAAAAWRAAFLPLETVRSNLQVRGSLDGRVAVVQRVRAGGLLGLYSGTSASFTAGFLGHFPFFLTVNLVSQALPLSDDATVLQKIGRNGGMGFLAAMFSDVVSNMFKIIGMNKQVCTRQLTYYETARRIAQRDGLSALITRGLKTRLIGNGLQGATFVLLWKEMESRKAASSTLVP